MAHRRFAVIVVMLGIVLSLGTYTVLGYSGVPKPHVKEATTVLFDVDGHEVGQIIFRHAETAGMIVEAKITDLPQGYYTFAIHDSDRCDPSGEFASVGERIVIEALSFTDPYGGLLPIYVMRTGRGDVTFSTDRIGFETLFAQDYGRTVVVSALPDSAETGNTASAQQPALISNASEGQRVACGVPGVE
jgi:Cu/Zn superoxide dismutase